MERLHHLVFDEADQLVDDQNRPILKSILKQVPVSITVLSVFVQILVHFKIRVCLEYPCF